LFTARAYATGATGRCEEILCDGQYCEDLRVFFNDQFANSRDGIGYIPPGFGADLVRIRKHFSGAQRILCAHKLWPSAFEGEDSLVRETCDDYGAMVGMALSGDF
jgi:hypothetical protein